MIASRSYNTFVHVYGASLSFELVALLFSILLHQSNVDLVSSTANQSRTTMASRPKFSTLLFLTPVPIKKASLFCRSQHPLSCSQFYRKYSAVYKRKSPARFSASSSSSSRAYYDPEGALKAEGVEDAAISNGQCTMCKGKSVLPCYVCNGLGFLGSSGRLVCKYCRGSKVVHCPLCADEDDPYELSYADPKGEDKAAEPYPYPYNPQEHGELSPDTKID